MLCKVVFVFILCVFCFVFCLWNKNHVRAANSRPLQTFVVDLLTLAVLPLCAVFPSAAGELTVNERPSPCPRGSMGCRRSGRRRGTRRSTWTSCCLLGSSSNSQCLETTPSEPSKKYVSSHYHFFFVFFFNQ